MAVESLFCPEMARIVEHGNAWPMNFRDRFCEQFRCDASGFEEAVFWRCLNRPHAWLFARFLFPKDKLIFKEDLDFIHELGGIRDPLIFKNEVNRYHGRNVREKGWIRGTFGIRVSGKRVMKLKNRLYRNVA
jgi:hypothetical protein